MVVPEGGLGNPSTYSCRSFQIKPILPFAAGEVYGYCCSSVEGRVCPLLEQGALSQKQLVLPT